jgi:hypothetical protein
MSRNPYAPPDSAVADSDQEPPREKPAAIRRAIVLIWLSLALNAFILAIDWRFLSSEIPLLGLIATEALVVALTVWLVIKIEAGRNWARIVYLVLLVISLPIILPDIMTSAERAQHVAGLKMVELGLDIGTLYLLFLPGRDWFRK